MSARKTTSAWARGLGWGLGVALLASLTPAPAAATFLLRMQVPSGGSAGELEERYNESLRKATQENDISGATNEVDGALAEFRNEDPENPQLAALHLLRGVLLFAVDGDKARESILNSFKAALRVHPWAQFEPSMRSEPLDALLEEARDQISEEAPAKGLRFGQSDPRCGDPMKLHVAYSEDLGVSDATLHWRLPGQGDFQEREMRLFAGVASAELPATAHEDRNVEFYISLGDAEVSVGSASSPQSLGMDCGVPDDVGEDASEPNKRDARKRKRDARRAKRNRRVGFRLSGGMGWGVSYGDSERVYDVANPNKPGHYSLLATACAIARRAAPRGGALPSTEQLFGSDAASPASDSIFAQVASSPAQAADLAKIYDADRCAQRHPINAGVAPSLFHVEPELSVRVSKNWEAALFSRIQLVHGLNILAPVQDAGLDEVKPAFEKLTLPMPWTVGLSGRYRKEVPSVSGLSWFVGGYAGYGRAALAVPMPFGHDRNGNSVADENELGCSVSPREAPVFPAMDGCSNPDASKSEIEALRELGKDGDKARDVLVLGKIFAGVEVGVEYLFTPVVGITASGQVGVWFAGHRTSGLVDLKLGPSFHF